MTGFEPASFCLKLLIVKDEEDEEELNIIKRIGVFKDLNERIDEALNLLLSLCLSRSSILKGM